MTTLNPHKVFVQYRDAVKPYEPIMDRKYTITHSDITAELFVFASMKYAEDQVTEMRDEVRLAWENNAGIFYLKGSVVISGEGIPGNEMIRNTIFYNQMPTALTALRQADRFLFEVYPQLDKAKILIHFISSNPAYDKTYSFGSIGRYR